MIVEKHQSRLNFSRAMFLNSHSLSLLSKYGLHKTMRNNGRLIGGVCIVGGISNDAPLCICDLSPYIHGDLHPISIPQNAVERVLEEHLNGLGVFVSRPVVYKDHRLHSEHIISTVQDSSGDIISIKSRYLLGADGFHSSVRKRLGLVMDGETLSGARFVAADVTLPAYPFAADICVWISEKGAMIAIRMGETAVRLAATNEALREHMLSLCSPSPPPAPPPQVDWMADFDIHHFHTREHGRGHVQLAGDAVHVHSPIGGRGMNMGIADALALGEAVAAGGCFEEYHRTRQKETMNWVSSNKTLSLFACSQHFTFRWIRWIAVGMLRVIGKIWGGDKIALMAFELISGVPLPRPRD